MRIVLLSLIATLGCAAKPNAPTTPAAVATAPAHEETCYAGTSRVMRDGTVLAEIPTVAKRTLDPATSSITEDVTQVGERGVEHYVVE